jgi:type II secretory pathway predicted ATPase ExeA
MRSALESLGLEELVVIHAGAESYPLAPQIRAVGLARMREDVPALKQAEKNWRKSEQ